MQAVTITQITPPELETLIENSVRKILNSQSTSTPQQAKDELLTVQDTAKFLSLSVPTVYGLISKGEIPVMKRSKRCYFSKDELINYLKQGRKKTLSEIDTETDAFLSNRKRKGVSHA
jgi:excisionase family DNA binding protein